MLLNISYLIIIIEHNDRISEIKIIKQIENFSIKSKLIMINIWFEVYKCFVA